MHLHQAFDVMVFLRIKEGLKSSTFSVVGVSDGVGVALVFGVSL